MLVLLAVGIHFEALSAAYWLAAHATIPHRLRIALAVLGAMLAHVFEVLTFAAGWMLLVRSGVGELSEPDLDVVGMIYFSFSTYTSLGYGDIVPIGNARILAGVESLAGLVLIAWTASFSYLEMRENWAARNSPRA